MEPRRKPRRNEANQGVPLAGTKSLVEFKDVRVSVVVNSKLCEEKFCVSRLKLKTLTAITIKKRIICLHKVALSPRVM